MLFVFNYVYWSSTLISYSITITRCVSLVKQELLTLPVHMSSQLVFSWVRSFLCNTLEIMFVLLSFFFWSLYVYPLSTCGFWWPLWCFLKVVLFLTQRYMTSCTFVAFPMRNFSQSDPNNISDFFLFIGMSRCWRSDETPLWITCAWL